MQQQCVICRQSFTIDQGELEFLERVSPVIAGKTLTIPPPTHCPQCRMQRRFAYRNERFLYRLTCALTGKQIISFYPPNTSLKIADKDAWWSDVWDALNEGRDIDFSRPFFGQMRELRQSVPRLGMIITLDEGSAFSAYSVNTKSCYMCCSCVVNEGSLYCYQANDSVRCIDCSSVSFCELCFDCIHCHRLYASISCRDCENGSNLVLCEDCRGCSDCIGCKNLVNRKHCIFNEQSTPDQVAALRKTLGSQHAMATLQEKFRAFALTLPTRAAHLIQCENCTGDHLRNCRNVHDCFDVQDAEDCRYVCPIPRGLKDCRDCHYSPGSELVYDSMSGMRSQHSRFVLHCWDNDDLLYCDECFSSKHLFGCIGLKHKEYCILNKQYTKEEYEEIVPRLIAHMRSTEEYGEFFPAKDSPFPYNETIAQDEYPLTKDEILSRGWRWKPHADEQMDVPKVIDATELPDATGDTPDDVVHWAIRSSESKRPFRIIKQELALYRELTLPLPRLSPEERYRSRLKRRNPKKLWNRACTSCGKTMATSYAPGRPERVICEECYLATVY